MTLTTEFKSKVLKVEKNIIVLEVLLCEGTDLTKGKSVTQPRNFTREKFGNLQPKEGQFLIIRFNEKGPNNGFKDIIETDEDLSNLFVNQIYFDGHNLIKTENN